MQPVLSREQMRGFDRRAIDTLGLTGAVLMENAARGAVDCVLDRFPDVDRLVVVCGSGNNAGDGYAVARRWLALGRTVSVLALVPIERLNGDAAINAKAYQHLGGELFIDDGKDQVGLAAVVMAADVVVDAIFGTGLIRPIVGRELAIVKLLSQCGRPVIALDVPSGLDSDTGQVLGAAVCADLTVVFGALKLGLLTPSGVRHAGRLVVVDLGVPPPKLDADSCSAHVLEASDVGLALRRQAAPQHKGQAGRVVIVAGSPGKLGAARLAAAGAHRTGAGLVTVATFAEGSAQLDAVAVETMTHRLDAEQPWASLERLLESADAVAIGPGLGLEPHALELVRELVRSWTGPVVVDADALTLLVEHPEVLVEACGPRVLTPHPAEAARMLGETTAAVVADRFGAARRLTDELGSVVVLKGAHTLIQDGPQSLTINGTGNSALSVGGSGDVLTGVIAALCARMPAAEAARTGVWLHGRAGDRWAQAHGTTRGMLARELADGLPLVFAEALGDVLSREPALLTD
jgi:NAD(P)H-hydrate epimerase